MDTGTAPLECASKRVQMLLKDPVELHLTCPECGCDRWYPAEADPGAYTCANCTAEVDLSEMGTKRTASGNPRENADNDHNNSPAPRDSVSGQLTETPQILSAQECWAGQTNRADFIAACNEVMKSILKARDNGKRECLFDPRPVEQASAVKEEFKRKGYTFRPYSFSGGVWQDEILICW